MFQSQFCEFAFKSNTDWELKDSVQPIGYHSQFYASLSLTFFCDSLVFVSLLVNTINGLLCLEIAQNSKWKESEKSEMKKERNQERLKSETRWMKKSKRNGREEKSCSFEIGL